MRRARKIAFWVAGAIILLPVVLVVLILIAANTGPGRRLIESEAASQTGGMIRLTGLGGRFPDALRLARLEVADARGTWLTAEGVALDWSPSALLFRRARIDVARIAHLTVARLPVASAPAKPVPPGQAGFSLPVAIDLRALHVPVLDLGAKVAGVAASLQVDGHADLPSLQAGSATIDIARRDGPGAYHVDGVVSAATITAHVTAQEPQGGLIAALAKLPALGGLAVDLSIDGPRRAERAHIVAAAGALHIAGDGSVDLPGQTQDVTLAATAPAMRPRPDVSWKSVDLHAHVTGSFTKPDVSAHLTIGGLLAGGASLTGLVADVSGNQGAVSLHAVLSGALLPGPKPELFASAPLDLIGDIRLDTPSRPVRFKLTHPLLTADGSARTGGDISAAIHTVVPDVAPFAAIGNVDLRGSTDATATLTMHHGDADIGVTGKADFTGGQAPVPALLGPTTFAASASLAGQDITIHNAQVNGRAIRADVTGSDRASGVDMAWHVALTDLSALSPKLVGALNAAGHVGGPTDRLAVTADVTGEAGSPQFAKAPVSLTLRGDHLPAAPQASLQGSFRLAGAPATLQAEVTTNEAGGLHVVLQRADWKSLAARADMVLPKGEKIPVGTLDIRMAQIGDAAALAGQDITGGLTAKLTSSARDAKIIVQGSNLAAGPRRIAGLSLTGAATGVETDPDVNARLTLTGIEAQGITGNATVNAAGKQSALQLRAHAGLQNVQGAPATLDIAALLNGTAKQATLQTVTADWKTLALRLLAPSRVDFGNQIAVDHLRVGVNQAQIALSGRLSPTLDLTASVHNVTPDLAKAILPDVQAAGIVTADARLTGTTGAPNGTVHLTAAGLRLRTGPAAALPPAQIAATLQLNGTSARVNAHVDAGPKLHLTATGTAPLSATGALAVQTRGNFDVALLNPILQAGGREARGQASLAISAAGTVQAPRIAGTITLAGGEIQDFTQGVHLTRIVARIDADGDTLRIAQFTADAAPGTIGITGTVGALAPGMPVDLRITARNAKPLASDLLTAQFDADLTVQGHVAGDSRAAGKILLHRVEINVPDSFPPSVAVLNVRRPGDKPPPAAASAAPPPGVIHLDMVVDAPRNIFVRGHGLDAELGGKLTVAGTAAAPQISGGFDMRRGDFSLAGTTLNFSKGTVGFDGTGVSGKIDPTLNFEADSYQGGITATLKVTGYADGPKIALSSVPDLPQDEVLAHLLFGQSMKQLTPIQIAEIGAALAELSGVTGGGNPLNAIRKGLGLDRLNVGGGTNGAGASVQAGRYVATGVYVGAKQSTSGAGGTQAQVQVDLTRHLKLQTTLGTGGGTAQGATPDNDPGSSVGLAYQFEY
jgi:translocation and assembly module TamB